MESAPVQALMNGLRRRSSRVGIAACAAAVLSLAAVSDGRYSSRRSVRSQGVHVMQRAAAGAPSLSSRSRRSPPGAPYVVPAGGKRRSCPGARMPRPKRRGQTWMKVYRPSSGREASLVVGQLRCAQPGWRATVDTFPYRHLGEARRHTRFRSGLGLAQVHAPSRLPETFPCGGPFTDQPDGATMTFC